MMVKQVSPHWFFAAVLFLCGFLTACNQTPAIIDTRPRYTVLFDQNPAPHLMEKGIYHLNYKIGDILDDKLAPDGQHVMLTIALNPEYLPMVTQYTTFYPKNGRLVYNTFAQNGAPLQPGTTLPGCTSETQFLLRKVEYFGNQFLEEGGNKLLEMMTKALEGF